MWETKKQHMCLQHRCDQSVLGKKVFAHCQKHLDPFEKRMAENDVESQGLDVLFDSVFDEAFRSVVMGDIERNIKDKEEALSSAYKISQFFWNQRRERFALLPNDHSKRLRDREMQLFDTDGDWFYDKQEKKS